MTNRQIIRRLGEMRAILDMTTGQYQEFIELKTGQKVTKGEAYYHRGTWIKQDIKTLMKELLKEGKK